jgi:catalase
MPKRRKTVDAKSADLAQFIQDDTQQYLTTDQGVRINDDQHSLNLGERGPSLLEDFILRENIRFDHIPGGAKSVEALH